MNLRIKHDFFKEINTEEKAYFLGLIFADGCNNGKVISLGLKEDDKYLVEKFKSLIDPSNTIKMLINIPKKTNHKTMFYFTVNSRGLSDDLSSHGAVPRKSLILEFPKSIPENLIHHFIRGYFDGDGSILKAKPLKEGYSPQYKCKFFGTKNFITKLQEILSSKLTITSCIGKHKKISVLIITGNKNCDKFCEWLYQNATIFMTRKKDRYDSLISLNKKIKSNKTLTTYDCIDFNKNAFAKFVGISRMTLYKALIKGLSAQEIVSKYKN